MEAMNATNRHLEKIMSFQDLVKITKPRYQAIEYQGDAEYENLVALIEALNKAKPATSKGVYLRKVAVSSTMGLGVRVDTQTIAA